MNKFGIIKTKVLQKLTEAYANGNKSEIKEILTLVKSDKDFRDLYLFYEEIENKYFENPEDAKEYLKEIRETLIQRTTDSRSFCESLDKRFNDVKVEENELYSYLDTLAGRRTLKNADRHIIAKNKLVEHLTKKKEVQESISNFTENEGLFHAILTNNFNVLYNNTLNEEQKEELKNILTITNEELQSNFQKLKTEVQEKLEKISSEEKNDDLLKKINESKEQLVTMDISKFNYYKLQQLKNGL